MKDKLAPLKSVVLEKKSKSNGSAACSPSSRVDSVELLVNSGISIREAGNNIKHAREVSGINVQHADVTVEVTQSDDHSNNAVAQSSKMVDTNMWDDISGVDRYDVEIINLATGNSPTQEVLWLSHWLLARRSA